MRVEMSLTELLLNAIGADRIWRVQFSRKHGSDPGDERRTFEDLSKVIGKSLDGARAAVIDQAQREMQEKRSEWRRDVAARDAELADLRATVERLRGREAAWVAAMPKCHAFTSRGDCPELATRAEYQGGGAVERFCDKHVPLGCTDLPHAALIRSASGEETK